MQSCGRSVIYQRSNNSHNLFALQCRTLLRRSIRSCRRQVAILRTPGIACRPYLLHGKVIQRFQQEPRGQRTLFLDSLPAVLVPPIAFFGLFISLWIYKCMMMVVFQDKIIYMPYVPPFSRAEKLEDYVKHCNPVQWQTRNIRSLDGTKIAVCIGRIQSQGSGLASEKPREIVICYFQGNGSSLPPRLPLLSNVLKSIETLKSNTTHVPAQYTIAALSYRGYWSSSGRASQLGIELDAQALLYWIEREFFCDRDNLEIILWGQSIGAGVASTAAASYDMYEGSHELHIAGLVLETPFSNIRSILSAMYPQKWLPYGYLWPFLWNHWNTETALKRIAQQKRPPRVLLLPAARDEIVPPSEADKLEELCLELGLRMQRRDIVGALHTEATSRKAGQDIVAKFIVDSQGS